MRKHLVTIGRAIEMDHVILASAYVITGIVGQESPWLMAAGYISVGMVHTGHIIARACNSDRS